MAFCVVAMLVGGLAVGLGVADAGGLRPAWYGMATVYALGALVLGVRSVVYSVVARLS
jgi:hypothetical protein